MSTTELAATKTAAHTHTMTRATAPTTIERDGEGAVVVGCDGSWWSQRAVEAAAVEAAAHGWKLVLLAVAHDRPGQSTRLQDFAIEATVASASAAAAARRAAKLIATRAADQPVQIVVAADPEDPQVRALAGSARLLVLGRYGAHGQGSLSLGSVSSELAKVLACPLLVVADRPGPGASVYKPVGGNVILGLGAGPDCADAVAVAMREATVRRARLVAVHALPSRHGGATELRTAWARCRSALASARRRAPSVIARLVLVRDDPVAALAARAGAGDLIVVGTKGGGRLAGLIRGSTSRALLDAMPCDVLVVPPAAQSRQAPRATTRRVRPAVATALG